MWNSRNKNDLIIEVWEKLDCESIGTAEIEAIESVVSDVFGEQAVESPMKIARLLADEGAELRHSEVMALFVERASDRPYDAALLNLLDTTDLGTTLRSIRNMENLRRKFLAEGDRDGLRLLRQKAIEEKSACVELSKRRSAQADKLTRSVEIAEWLTLWLQSPEIFEQWIGLRKKSDDFVSKFGEI